MAAKLPVAFCSLFLAILVATPQAVRAEEGKDIFQKQCASCHTIGGGDRVGPDLKGVGSKRSAEWLTSIITDPDKLTASKDPAQLELVQKFGMQMPKLGVSQDDARKLVAFLQGGTAPAAAAGPATAEAPPAAAPPSPPTPQLIASGKALFTGKTKFANGGAPCVSCHTLDYPGIYGGALAADLTNIYSSMGDAGIRGVLKSLGFPVMRKVYADRPLTDAESNALVALFQGAAARKATQRNPYPLTGVGFFVIFVILAAVLKRRNR